MIELILATGRSGSSVFLSRFRRREMCLRANTIPGTHAINRAIKAIIASGDEDILR
jgi:cystathionine beta-lyase family protein involved in aluminum resistance